MEKQTEKTVNEREENGGTNSAFILKEEKHKDEQRRLNSVEEKRLSDNVHMRSCSFESALKTNCIDLANSNSFDNQASRAIDESRKQSKSQTARKRKIFNYSGQRQQSADRLVGSNIDTFGTIKNRMKTSINSKQMNNKIKLTAKSNGQTPLAYCTQKYRGFRSEFSARPIKLIKSETICNTSFTNNANYSSKNTDEIVLVNDNGPTRGESVTRTENGQRSTQLDGNNNVLEKTFEAFSIINASETSV
jgi:hypothetical protein